VRTDATASPKKHTRKRRRDYTRAEGYTEHDLVQFAHDHLAASYHLLSKSPTFYDSAAALGHLGIELLLKACLLHLTDRFPATHDLLDLWTRFEEVGPPVCSNFGIPDLLARLNSLGTLRYPSPPESHEVSGELLNHVLEFATTFADQMPDHMRQAFGAQGKKGGRTLIRIPIK